MAIIDFEWNKGTQTTGPYNRRGTAHNIIFSKEVILNATSIDYAYPNNYKDAPITLKIYELQADSGVTSNSIKIFERTENFLFNGGSFTKCLFSNLSVKLKANKYYGFVFDSGSASVADTWANGIVANDLQKSDLVLQFGLHNMYTDSFLGGSPSYWGGLTNITNFSIKVDDDVKTEKKLLIQHQGQLKKYTNSWIEVGVSPGTKTIFDEHGMSSISSIVIEKLKELQGEVELLAYTETDKVFKADIEIEQVFNLIDKNYRGTATIETKEEVLPPSRKTLWINADHTGCLFSYSLDSGSTWTAFVPGDILDVSSKAGTAFKVKINLQNDDARLDALAYAWA